MLVLGIVFFLVACWNPGSELAHEYTQIGFDE